MDVKWTFLSVLGYQGESLLVKPLYPLFPRAVRFIFCKKNYPQHQRCHPERGLWRWLEGELKGLLHTVTGLLDMMFSHIAKGSSAHKPLAQPNVGMTPIVSVELNRPALSPSKLSPYACWIIAIWVSTISSIQAQVFQQVQISAIEQMSHNWGNAVADYDQDGDLDIFIVAYDGFEKGDPHTWSRLLKNNGSALWVDVTESAGLGKQYQSDIEKDHKIGAAWGDYDNDGYPDLLLTHAGGIQLYHNQQDGTFEDVSRQSKIRTCLACVNSSALWWDYDKDGKLDLYISDYVGINQLYHNEGDGTFSDVSLRTDLDDHGSTWCSIALDVNKDTWPDLYVVNDYGFSRLYINQEGESFIEATEEYGLTNTGDAMGIAIGDYNQDGHFDLYVTNISEFQPNPLFTGSAEGPFTKDQETQGVANAHWGWGTQFFDADHDGDEDLYAVNGFGSFTYPNKFFKSTWAQGSPEFVDWSGEAACDGVAQGMGLEVFDYDKDGDLDMLVSNTNDTPYLYNNVGVMGNTNWIQIKLEGTTSNRDAFGAIVKASGNGRSYYRYHHGAGIMSQSIKPVHFGLGEMDIIDTLTVVWPSDVVQEFYDVPSNQIIHITENEALDTSTKEPDAQHNNFSILRVVPNPFEEVLTIDLQTLRGSLVFQVISSSGQILIHEAKEIESAGADQLTWNGRNAQGIRQASGLYYFRIWMNQEVLTGKIMLK